MKKDEQKQAQIVVRKARGESVDQECDGRTVQNNSSQTGESPTPPSCPRYQMLVITGNYPKDLNHRESIAIFEIYLEYFRSLYRACLII